MQEMIKCQQICVFATCLKSPPCKDAFIQQQQKRIAPTRNKEKISLKLKQDRKKIQPLFQKIIVKEHSEKQTRSNTQRIGSFNNSFKQKNQNSCEGGLLSYRSLLSSEDNIFKEIIKTQQRKTLIGSQSYQIHPLFVESHPDYYRNNSFTERVVKEQNIYKERLSKQVLISNHQPKKNSQLSERKKTLKQFQVKLQRSRNANNNDFDTLTSLLYSSDAQQRISQSTVHIDFFNPSEKTLSHLQSQAQISTSILINI